MPTETVKILDRLNKELSVTDYRLHQVLEVSKSAVSNWRVGKGSFSDTTALKIAELLNENPSYLLALAAAERATDEAAQKAWASLARRLQRSAAAALLCVVGFHAEPSRALVVDAPAVEVPSLYIMVNNGSSGFLPAVTALPTTAA